jgi:hypothetical protein
VENTKFGLPGLLFIPNKLFRPGRANAALFDSGTAVSHACGAVDPRLKGRSNLCARNAPGRLNHTVTYSERLDTVTVDRVIAWSFWRLIGFGDALEYWGTQARSLFLDLWRLAISRPREPS